MGNLPNNGYINCNKIQNIPQYAYEGIWKGKYLSGLKNRMWIFKNNVLYQTAQLLH